MEPHEIVGGVVRGKTLHTACATAEEMSLTWGRWFDAEQGASEKCERCRHMLNDQPERCPHCKAPKIEWEQRNHSPSYPLDYDWYCTACGEFVRVSSH